MSVIFEKLPNNLANITIVPINELIKGNTYLIQHKYENEPTEDWSGASTINKKAYFTRYTGQFDRVDTVKVELSNGEEKEGEMVIFSYVKRAKQGYSDKSYSPDYYDIEGESNWAFPPDKWIFGLAAEKSSHNKFKKLLNALGDPQQIKEAQERVIGKYESGEEGNVAKKVYDISPAGPAQLIDEYLGRKRKHDEETSDSPSDVDGGSRRRKKNKKNQKN